MLRVDLHVADLSPTYRAVSDAHLAAREADEIRVVYDRRSGLTHLMTPDLAAVFDVVRAAPADAPAVLAALQAQFVTEAESDDVLGAVAARLDDLAKMALVDPLR